MKIIWTNFAIDTLKYIVEYHKEVANYKTAEKIRKEIFSSTRQLLKYPESGQLELSLKDLNENYRYVLSGNYKVIYKIIKNEIVNNGYIRHPTESNQD